MSTQKIFVVTNLMPSLILREHNYKFGLRGNFTNGSRTLRTKN
jgi:hypothetical protein